VLAAFLKESGASLAQSLIVIAGLILSTAVFAGIGSVAAKRGSSSIAVVSRAAFGVWGNVIPALVMLLVKFVWSIALFVFGARILSPLISGQPWFAGVSSQFIYPAEFTAFMLTSILMVVISALVAGFGGIVMLRAQQIVGSFSVIGILGIGYFVFAANSILDLQQGELLANSQLLDLAIFSFMLFGVTVFTQSGGAARYISENFSAGMIGVNIGVPVPREPFSFGGWNESKFGVGDITGKSSIAFWTKLKKTTTKWNPEARTNWMS
jgi:hypothetical protein